MENDLRSPRKRPDIDYYKPEDLSQRIENLEKENNKKDTELKELNEKIEELAGHINNLHDIQREMISGVADRLRRWAT